MEEIGQIPAQAVVKVSTKFGACCLWEIKGLKEGTILDGTYNPANKAFDFTFNGEDAMLWIGEDGELVSLGEGQRHKYMMLDRLLTDCHYLLFNKEASDRSLYYPSVARHMFEMRALWDALNIKPRWLSRKEIGRLEHRMNRALTERNRKHKKQLKK